MKKVFLIAVAAFLFVACNCGGTGESGTADAVINNICQRKSVRSYTAQPIGDDTIDILLRAAMAAPSGVDVRPWSFVVLKDKSNFDAIFADNMNLPKFKEAAVVIVLCADTTRAVRGSMNGEREANPIWRDDMGACTENLLLAAEAHGLGAVWTACYPFADRMATVKAELALPAEVVPYCIVPIGHHDGTTLPKDKYDATRIHNDRW